MVSGARRRSILQKHPGATPDEVKKLLTSTAYEISAKAQAIGGGELQLATTLLAAVPNSTQTWPSSDGSGKLELSRGTDHLTLDGVELTGEQDIFGQPFDSVDDGGARGERQQLVGRQVERELVVRQQLVGQLVERQLLVRQQLVGQ